MRNWSKGNYIKGFFTRPWVIETVVFFLVAWQESIRLSIRTAHAGAVTSRLTDFYFYNFGNFVNGYIMAYIFDGLVNYFIFLQKPPDSKFYTIFVSKITPGINTILATLGSALVIIIFEAGQSSAFTTADLWDIPAGAGGALVYCVIRFTMLKLTSDA